MDITHSQSTGAQGAGVKDHPEQTQDKIVTLKLFAYCEKKSVKHVGVQVKLSMLENQEYFLAQTKDHNLWKTEVNLISNKNEVTLSFCFYEPRDDTLKKIFSKEEKVYIDEGDNVFCVHGDNKPMLGFDAIFNHFISLPGRNLGKMFKDIKTLTKKFQKSLEDSDKKKLLVSVINNMESVLQYCMDIIDTARRIFCAVLLVEKYLHLHLHDVEGISNYIFLNVLEACRYIDTKTEEATEEDIKHIFNAIYFVFYYFKYPDKSFMDYVCFVLPMMPLNILIAHFVRMKNIVPVMIKDNHIKTFSELFFIANTQEEFIPLVLTLQKHLHYRQLLSHVTHCFENLCEEDRVTAMCKKTIQAVVSITKDLIRNKKSNIEAVVAVWQNARGLKYCQPRDFREVFQTEFLTRVSYMKEDGQWNVQSESFLFLYQDIAAGHVFKTNKEQLELFNAICHSKNFCVLETFIAILNVPKIQLRLGDEQISTICRAWITSWSTFLNEKTKMEHTCSLYYAFNYLVQSETIKSNKCLVSSLSNFILDHVRKDKLKLFGQIAAIGKENISDVNTLVLEHVGKLLTQLDMEKANEFILRIFPSDNIQVDSRLLAEVLVHFMKITKDEYFPNDGDGDGDGVYFNKILLTQHIFWNKITQASGPGAKQFLFSNELYQQHEAIIKKMVDLFDKGDILLKDFRSLYKQQENYHNVVEKFAAKNEYQLKNMFDKYAETVNGAGVDMELTITTLERISLRMPLVIRNDINRYKREIIDTKRNFLLGKVSLSSIAKRNFLPAAFVNTMQCIKDLEIVTGCQTFWNCSAGIVHEIEAQFQSYDLSGYVVGDERAIQSSYKIVEMCLQRLQIDGIRSYEERWAPLFERKDVPLSDLKILFQHLGTTLKDLQLVIETAEKHQKKRLPLKVDIDLKRYFSHVEYEERVRIISDCLAVIGIVAANDPLVREALQNYENLKAEKEEELTLYKISDCIHVIDSFRVEGNVLHVSRVLANSSELLKFLGDIKDVDIGNLTDAVEEHSEQHIQESTVSDLIDVKRFLQPVLAAMPFKDAQDFFFCLDDAVAQSKMADKLHVKILSCNQFVFSLQNLYRNIANRGEITKEILKHISTEGIFCFIMPREGDCELKIKYESRQHTHDMSKIEDLRSRALLIASAKNKNMAGDNMEEFIFRALDLIELSLDICKLCSSLKSMGHLSFETYQEEKTGKDLDTLKAELQIEHKQWTQTVQKYRDEYSQMNFLNGSRLLILFSFLSKGNHKTHATMLMKFINHDFVDMVSLKCKYERLSSLRGNDNVDRRLKDVGKALDLIFTNEVIPRQEFPAVKWDAITSGVVKTGRAHVIALEENSNLVHRVLLCLFYQNGRSLPKANNVLFCDADTEKDEIFLFMRRSHIYQQELFLLVNVQTLPSELQTFIINEVHEYQRCQYQFRLALICCGGKTHSFLEQFMNQVEDCKPLTEIQIRDVLEALCSDVFVITSQLPGLGKTQIIYKVASTKDLELKTFHLSGEFNKETYIQRLLGLKLKDSDLLHIDLGDVADACRTDIFLFELIVLGYVSTKRSAFALPTKNICIEVANSFSSLLREKYNTIFFFKHQHLQWKNAQIIASQDTRSPMQIVCYYLKAVKENFANVSDIDLKQVQALPQRECIDLVAEHLDVMPSVSFAIMNIFLNVLAEQLKKLSSSVYFKSENLEYMAGNGSNADIKKSLVNALVSVSSDFATRSVKTCKADQLASLNYKAKSKAEQMIERVGSLQKWGASNHLMLLFHANSQTISAIFKDIKSVPLEIKNMFERQLRKNLENFDKLNAGELLQLLERLTTIKPSKDAEKRLETYALTVDNFLKMVLISLRTQAHVPVIVMGETGCGKTSLIRFLAAVCGIKLEVLSIHAGITEQFIFDFVTRINKEAMESYSESFWIFMDEINTCAHLGLIADILCHHMLLGKRLADNVTILAACNPYRIRAESAVSKTGLQGARVKEDELSRLVYRVHPLPENMIDFVWDYGSLPSNDEMLYIQRMVQKWSKDEVSTIFAQLLILSQNFIRQKNNNDYCTSLRDVDRCINLAKWFNDFEAKKPTQCRCNDNKVKCIILALTLGYYCRLETAEDRHEYRQKIIDATKDSKLPGLESEEKIQEMISKEQKFILNSMELPLGIAKNVALQENVFVMLHCILNRIPVFLIGKPGCSKSLSMQLIRSNLRGKDSKNKFFQELPSLNCVAFQGSESCTSDGIVKVFQKAEKFQEYNKEKKVLSVVILDEIGLAGISPFNPLKVLHSLLEPNGKSVPDVAVVGISNWALDASKMNRGIHLSRPEMNEKDLAETGELISQSLVKTKPSSFLGASTYEKKRSDIIRLPLNDVASCYCEYYKKQRHSNFHGLRDFYFFTKYISRSVLNLNQEKCLKPQKSIDDALRHGLWRNFGGLAFDNVFEEFAKCFFNPFKQNIIPDLNQLILENLQDKDARHLMLITTGDVVLDQLVSLLTTHKKEHQVILGSRFQEDCTDDYNCHILNKIILCMEQNLVLILRDLGVYGSLYDMLNQNYTVMGPRKNCRVAIGPYSNPMCYVNDDFKCIVLVDESKLDFSDPPFFNRFEKQHFGLAGQLDNEKNELTKDIEATLKDLSGTENEDFNIDSFIPHFSENLVPSLLLQLSQKKREFNLEQDAVKQQSLKILIHACHPESMVRMKKSKGWDKYSTLAEKLQDFYYQLPVHNGLEHFINKMGILSKNQPQRDICQGKHIDDHFFCDNQSEADDMLKGENSRDFLVFTHSNYHLNLKDIIKNHGVMIERLGSIKSEKQLSNLIEDYLASNNKLLLMQLRAGIDSIHLQMVKHCMETLRSKKIKSPDMKTRKRFMLLCHLERTDGRNITTEMTYLSKWHIFTVSDLEANPVELSTLLNMSMVEAMDSVLSLRQVILDSLSWVFIRIKYTQIDAPIKHIEELKDKISQSEFVLGLLESIVQDQMSLVSDKEPDWLLKLALDQHMLCSTFHKAVKSKIQQSIQHVLAKVIFRLEEMGIFNCIFLEDDLLTQRQKTIKSTVLKNKMAQEEILNLNSISAPKGLNFYKCSISEVALKFPFSRLVFKKVEEYSAEYMDFVKQIQDPHSDSLSNEQVNELNQIFIDKLDSKLRMLSELSYATCQTDYIEDFVWMSLETFSSNLNLEISHKTFRWTLDKLVNLETLVHLSQSEMCISVHSTVWRYRSILSCVQTVVEKSHQSFGLDVDYLLSRNFVKVEFKEDEAIEDIFYEHENMDVSYYESEDHDLNKEEIEADDNEETEDDEKADDEETEDGKGAEDAKETNDDEKTEDDEGAYNNDNEHEYKNEVKKESNSHYNYTKEGEEECIDNDAAKKFYPKGAKFVNNKNIECVENRRLDTEDDDEHMEKKDFEDDRDEDNSDYFKNNNLGVEDVYKREDNVYAYSEHERMNRNTSKVGKETVDENAMDSPDDWKKTLVHKIVMEIFPARTSVIASHKDILRWYKGIRGFISEMGQLAYIHLLDIVSFLSDVAVEIFIRNSNSTRWQLFLQMSKNIVQWDFKMTSGIAPKFVEYFVKLHNSNLVNESDIQIILSTFFEIAFQNLYNDKHDTLNEMLCLLPKVYTMDPYLATLRLALERMLSTINTDNLLGDQNVRHILKDIAVLDCTEDLKSSLTNLVLDVLETQILPSILPQEIFLDIGLLTDPLVETFLSAIHIYKEERTDNYILAVAYIKYFLHVSLQLILAGELNVERIDLYCSIYNNLSDDESEHPNETTSSKVQQLQQFFFSVLELLRDRNSVKGSLKNVKFVTSDRLLSVYDHMCRRPVMIYDMKTYHQVVVDINVDLNSGKVEKMNEYCNVWQQGKVNKFLVYGGILEVFFMGKLSNIDKAISKDYLSDLFQVFENTSAISAEPKKVLKKLLGLKDFGCTKYHLNTETEYSQWHLVSFLTHLLLMTAAGNNTSILFACTFKKEILQYRYFPETGLQTPKEWVLRHVACSCGYRVTSDENCVHCGHEPDPLEYDSSLEACDHWVLKTLLINEDISVGAKAIIRMIMCGSCLNAFSMETGNAAYIQTFFEVESGQQLEDYLWDNLIEDWNMLQTSLFLSQNELCLFLHSILKSCQGIFDGAKCSTKEEKDQVVKDLAQEIDASLKKRFQIISDLKSEFLSFKDGREATPIMGASELRLIELPTLQNLQLEASLVSSAKNPLLGYLLKNFDILQLPRHIKVILDWTKTMYRFANNRFLKVEVQEMYIDNVFDRETDLNRRESLRKMFRAFQDMWNTVRGKLPDYCEHLDMPTMESNLLAEFCLSFDETSVISKVLMHLVQIHNVIIDDILFLASKYNSKISSLRQWHSEEGMALIPWVELDKVVETNLVSLDIDETLLSFSGHSDGFNCGRMLKYNFDIIEKYITRGCLRKVVYIIPKKLEPIIFLDEIYKNSRDILNSIKHDIPQEDITQEMSNDIVKRQTEASWFSQLLHHLGTILFLLTKTKGKPQIRLTEYIDQWKKLIPCHKEIKTLMPESEHSIELRHIVSLYMLLEQLNGENLIKTNKFSKDYTQDIPYEAKKVLEDCAQIDIKLLKFTLRALQVFTHRCLQGENTAPSKGGNLSDFLSDECFWPIGVTIKGEELVLCLPEIPEVKFAQVIPSTLKLAHVRSTMHCLKDTIEGLDRKQQQTSLLALKSFPSSTEDKNKTIPSGKRKQRL